MRFSSLAFVALSLFSGLWSHAQTTFTWSTTASKRVFDDAGNWVGGVAPANDGSAALVFGDWTTSQDPQPTVRFTNSFSAYSLTFTGTYPHYLFDVTGGGTGLGLSHGITVGNSASGSVEISSGGPGLQLTGDQTWQIDGNLAVYSFINGPHSITKTGNGTLTLGGNGNFSGGLFVNAGGIRLASSSTDSDGITGPAGAGTIHLAPGTKFWILNNGDELDLHNTIELTGNTSIGEAGSKSQLNLYGGVDGTSLGTNLTVDGGTVVFHGGVGPGIASITVGNGAGSAAAVAFDGVTNLPATSIITTNSLSYVGMGGDMAQNLGHSAADLLAKVNPASFKGTLGFDDPTNGDYGTIDLTNFTHADFTGLGTFNGGFLNPSVTILAPTTGPHAGVLQFSAFQSAFFKVDAPLLTANGVNSVVIGRTDDFADNGTVNLGGNSDYTGGTTVNSGTLLLSCSSTPAGTGPIVVNSGATLALDTVFVSSTVTVNSGARLTGDGGATTGLILGGVLAPGNSDHTAEAINTLNFEDLTLGLNSGMELQVRDNGAGFDYDSVYVQNSATLTILADAAHPFTLKLISLNSDYNVGSLSGLTMGTPVTLNFLSTNGVSGTFTLGQNFLIDTSSFTTAFPGVTYSLTQTGNNFSLTFTPVPEPSTSALLALGLGLTGLTAWRRTRRA